MAAAEDMGSWTNSVSQLEYPLYGIVYIGATGGSKSIKHEYLEVHSVKGKFRTAG